jgi:hypothetical protein
LFKAGIKIANSMAMIAITTNSSINVNPFFLMRCSFQFLETVHRTASGSDDTDKC